MGDIAEAMLDGDFDHETGEWLGPGDGYPRTRRGSNPHRKGRASAELFGHLESLADEWGVHLKAHTPYHWQFRTSPVVNVYPTTRKVSVADHAAQRVRGDIVKHVRGVLLRELGDPAGDVDEDDPTIQEPAWSIPKDEPIRTGGLIVQKPNWFGRALLKLSGVRLNDVTYLPAEQEPSP